MGGPGADGKEGEAVRLRSHANNYISSIDQTETNFEINTCFFSQGLDGTPGASGSPGLPGAKVCFLLDP